MMGCVLESNVASDHEDAASTQECLSLNRIFHVDPNGSLPLSSSAMQGPETQIISGRHISDFYEIYVGEVLGSGSSSVVRVCINKSSKVEFAVKTISKQQITREKLAQIKVELAIMKSLNHPNIIRLVEHFETDDELNLVLDLCRGGELYSCLQKQANTCYSETAARNLVYTMLSTVNYCHEHMVIHGDLKLENFLFSDKDNDSRLMLIDFGMSQFFSPNEILHKAVGTSYYISPEVLRGNYNAKCDIWSIGIISYMLLSGTPPFNGQTDRGIVQAIREGKWEFPEYVRKSVSPEGMSFISSCLHLQPTNRPTASIALLHKWFDGIRYK